MSGILAGLGALCQPMTLLALFGGSGLFFAANLAAYLML